MATTSVLRLKVEDKEYNASLRQAQQGMQHLQQALQAAGKTFSQVDKSVVEYARGIGQMEAQSKTARGRIGEMTSAFVELSSQYNKMSAEVKSSDVGKALAQSIEQLRQRTVAAKQELEGLNRQLSNTKMPDEGGASGGFLSGLGGKMGGALQVFAGNMLTKAAGMVANLGTEIAGMVQQGAELARQGEGIRVAFERLGNGHLLDGLREATHGTVTDIELMKAAVKFNDFKLPVEELGTMLAFAQQKAKDTGQSVDYMVDSIVTGLGRKSLMILDNLGLSAAEIKEKMAETGDMTKAVGAIIREQMSKAGDYVETAADRAAQANVSLQNKMEELGRKFAPVEEASNQLWTSIKIGILDIIGGPLATLLNQLTEAGRLKNALNGINSSTGTGQTHSGKTLGMLKNYSGDKQGLYNRQVARYNELESNAWREANRLREQLNNLRKQQRDNPVAGNIQPLINEATRQLEKAESTAKAWRQINSEYQTGAKSILNPAKVSIDTSGAEQNITSLTKKLKDLQEQRKKAIAAGDSDLSKNLLKQINQTKADIKGLGGSVSTSTTGHHKVTDQERAAQKVAEAERTYAETLLKNSIRMEAGLDSTLENKKKELSAQERLFDAYNDAYATYKNPAYKEASQQAAEKIKQLAAEVKAASDAQEASKKAARELEAAQKKLADAQQKLADAQSTGSATAIYKAQQNVDRQQASVDMLSGRIPTDYKATMTVTADTKEALDKLKEIDGVSIDEKSMTVTADTQDALDKLREINGMSIDEKTVKIVPKTEGNTPFENLVQSVKADIRFDRMKVDETTLTSLLTVAIQHGLDSVTVDYGGLQQRIAEGIDIPDETWQQLKTEINEKLKEMGLEPIELDVKTGSVQSGKGGGNDNPYLKMNKDGKLEAKATELMSGIAGGIQNVVGGLQQLGIDLPQGFQNVVSGIQTVTSILSGIMSIVIAIKAITTADIIVPGFMANGGIVPKFAGGGLIGHAAAGMLIPGNSFSGDRLRMPVDGGSGFIGVNSGELILNAAQQNTIAGMLQGGQGMVHVTGELQGEKIVLAANRFLKRSGRGELVTWK